MIKISWKRFVLIAVRGLNDSKLNSPLDFLAIHEILHILEARVVLG
jgi:hypothetical protein